MSFNLNRVINDLAITTNKVKFSSPTYTSNLIIDISNAGVTMLNMNPSGTNFVGFMSNNNGLYFKGNTNSSFDQIGSSSALAFTPNIALSLSGSNLNVRYNPAILSIDAQNQLNISNGVISNNKLANSSIQIGSNIVSLGSALTSISASNITGRLNDNNLPLDFAYLATSNLNITSGFINNTKIGASNANTAIFTELTSLGNTFISKGLFSILS
jgi:hypothetical protein